MDIKPEEFKKQQAIQLINAVKMNDYAQVKKLLNEGATPNPEFEPGDIEEQPVIYAAKHGYLEILILLLEYGGYTGDYLSLGNPFVSLRADAVGPPPLVQRSENIYISPLKSIDTTRVPAIVALINNQLPAVGILLGYDPKPANKLLYYAVNTGNVEAVKFLLEMGVRPDESVYQFGYLENTFFDFDNDVIFEILKQLIDYAPDVLNYINIASLMLMRNDLPERILDLVFNTIDINKMDDATVKYSITGPAGSPKLTAHEKYLRLIFFLDKGYVLKQSIIDELYSSHDTDFVKLLQEHGYLISKDKIMSKVNSFGMWPAAFDRRKDMAVLFADIRNFIDLDLVLGGRTELLNTLIDRGFSRPVPGAHAGHGHKMKLIKKLIIVLLSYGEVVSAHSVKKIVEAEDINMLRIVLSNGGSLSAVHLEDDDHSEIAEFVRRVRNEMSSKIQYETLDMLYRPGMKIPSEGKDRFEEIPYEIRFCDKVKKSKITDILKNLINKIHMSDEDMFNDVLSTIIANYNYHIVLKHELDLLESADTIEDFTMDQKVTLCRTILRRMTKHELCELYRSIMCHIGASC